VDATNPSWKALNSPVEAGSGERLKKYLEEV
jgi:hypothetical protein